MKKEKQDIAIIFMYDESSDESEFIPLKTVYGYHDSKNFTFIDEKGNVFEHIICGNMKVGYGSSYDVEELAKKMHIPKFILKKVYLSVVQRYRFFKCTDTASDAPCIVMCNKSAKGNATHNFNNSNSEDLKLVCDKDIMSYYYENYRPFYNLINSFTEEVEDESRESVKAEEKEESKDLEENKIKDIFSLYEEITSQVIGQDAPIKNILTAIWKQYNNFSSDKSRNILICGKTGVGKTAIFRIINEKLGIPNITVDATNYTASGYIGSSVSDMLCLLLDKANGNLEQAEHGILIIDEIDKLSQTSSVDGSVGKKDVQSELLKLVEDGSYPITYNGEKYNFNTSNLMVIAMGSFSNISTEKVNPIGFIKDNSNNDSIKNEMDIRKIITNNGMIEEFVGRFSTIIKLNDLNYNDHLKILKIGKNNILSINREFFDRNGIKLTLVKGTEEKIAEISSKSIFGAREIDTIVERMLSEASFEIACHPKDYSELIVTPETVTNNKKYVLKRR